MIQGVPLLPMIVIGAILIATFAGIAFRLLNAGAGSLVGALIAVLAAFSLGVFDQSGGYAAVYGILGQNLGILGVLIGTSIVVGITGASGLFQFIAIRVVKLSRGRPGVLLPSILFVTAGVAAFLTPAPGALIMVALVLVIARMIEGSPVPYVLTVALGANSGALATYASGLPSLMIGTRAGIPYHHFLLVALPLALLSAVLACLVLAFIFRHRLGGGTQEAHAARVAAIDEWAVIRDERTLWRCGAILALTIAGFVVAPSIDIGRDYVAFAGAAAALLLSGFSVDEAMAKVKWSVVLFFIGIFTLIGVAQAAGLSNVLAAAFQDLAGGRSDNAVLVIVPAVFLASAVVGNIPAAAAMMPVIEAMAADGLAAEPMWWALIGAANLGGNASPVASIGVVIALHALAQSSGARIGWGAYMKAGGVIALLQMVLVLAFLSWFQGHDLLPRLVAGGAP